MASEGFWVLIIRKGQALVPTQAKTEAGFYLGIEPIEVIDARDRAGVEQAMLRAISRGNPPAPTPSRDSYCAKTDPLLRRAKAKSYSAFEKGTKSWKLSKHENAYFIVPYRPHEDGGAVEDVKRTERISGEAPIEEVVRRLVDRALGPDNRNAATS
jgi:hypothetical protein